MSEVPHDWEEEIRKALEHGEVAAAAAISELWRAEAPTSVSAHNLSGVAEMHRSNYLTAIEFFKSAIELDPGQPSSWCNLGLAYRQMGCDHDALNYLKKSAELAPGHGGIRANLVSLLDALAKYEEIIALLGHCQDDLLAEECWWLAKSYHALGETWMAHEVLSKSLGLHKSHGGLWRAYGDLALEIGQEAEAENAYRYAMACMPDDVACQRALGNLLVKIGRATEGKMLLERAIQSSPDVAELYVELAQAMVACGQFLDAKRALQNVIERWPENAAAYFNLGIVEGEHGSFALGLQYARKAIELDATMYLAHNHLGTLLEKKNAWQEAEESYRQAIALFPNFAEAHCNLGNLLAQALRLDEAEQYYRDSLRLKPDLVEAHHDLGLLLLLSGRYTEGWREYAWRWRTPDSKPHIRALDRPEWSGQNIAGKRILVYAEQGFGDTIQFVRYLPVLADLGAEVIFESPPQLERLLRGLSGIGTLFRRGEPIPNYDYHVPLLNVPGLMGTQTDNIPKNIPYISADEESASLWRERLAGLGEGRRVGIVWAGNPKHARDRDRSLAVSELSQLSDLEQVKWISLYKPASTAVGGTGSAVLPLVDWTGDLGDYADTAALVAGLDLVISVDTSVAHLAGAMGKPVWIMLPYAPDWRWMLGRKDSPWYPTAILYRQSYPGDWRGVLSEIKMALKRINEKKAP